MAVIGCSPGFGMLLYGISEYDRGRIFAARKASRLLVRCEQLDSSVSALSMRVATFTSAAGTWTCFSNANGRSAVKEHHRLEATFSNLRWKVVFPREDKWRQSSTGLIYDSPAYETGVCTHCGSSPEHRSDDTGPAPSR